MTIGTRLGLAFGLLVSALAAISVFGFANSTRGLDAIAVMKHNTDSVVALANARNAIWALRWDVAQFVAMANADERARIAGASARLRRQFDDAMDIYRALPRSEADKAALVVLDAAMNKYAGTRLRWFALYQAGRIEEATRLRSEHLTPAGAATVEALAHMIKIQETLTSNAERDAAATMTAARTALVAAALAALVLAALLTWLISRSLLRQLGGEPAHATAVANRIATGDLSQAIVLRSGDTTSLMAAMSTMQRDLKAHIEAERNAAIENQRIEKRLSGLLSLAPDAIIAADAAHRIVVFNKSAEAIFGYAAADVLGRSLEDLMPVRFRASHRRQVAAFAREPAPARAMGKERSELIGLRKDGSEFPAEASISILAEETGPIFFAVLRDVTDKKRAAQQLEHLATHDSLTELPNRALFMDRLAHTLAQAEREEKLAALLFIDLDGFKGVNDTFGHAVGDELLREIAQRLLNSVRRTDTVARLGGDEFAVILEQFEHVDFVSAIARKIIELVQQPFHFDDIEIVVSASVGITICPFDGKSVKDLMVDADRAMYVAKASGKSRFEFYSAQFAGTSAPEL